ncbi:hypothetical protein Tco_0474145 [Tanacetum coccineum]
MHFKIHSLPESGSSLSEHYYKFNALWRQHDSLINLPDCIYENSEKLKKHNQLLKLMQFLIGLDEVYAPIRSIILTTEPILDVKGAFATLSRMSLTGVISLIMCLKLVMIILLLWQGLILEIITDLVLAVCLQTLQIYIGWIMDSGASQHMTYTILNMFNVVDVSKLNMIVGHPIGTKALVTHVGNLKLTDKIVIHDVLVVPGYQVSLLSVHRLSKYNKFRVIFCEDTCVIQDSVLNTQVETGN